MYHINEGDRIYMNGIMGTIHLITNEGRLVVQLETGQILWNVEPRDVTKKVAETVA